MMSMGTRHWMVVRRLPVLVHERQRRGQDALSEEAGAVFEGFGAEAEGSRVAARRAWWRSPATA